MLKAYLWTLVANILFNLLNRIYFKGQATANSLFNGHRLALILAKIILSRIIIRIPESYISFALKESKPGDAIYIVFRANIAYIL